jgi:hypothetical protein
MPKLAATALGLALLVAAPRVRADDTKQACVDASEKGQALRDEHKLRAAREAFLACARDACPGPIKKDCGEWLAGVDKAMPSVIIVARERGQDVVQVAVDVDGKRVQESLDGAAMPLDPGPHTLRFTSAGRAPIEQTVVAREGDKARQLVVEFRGAASNDATPFAPLAPPPDVARPSSFQIPVAAWIFGGVTVAAAGSFTAFGLMGKSDLSHLRDTCGVTHSCAQADVDSAHTKLLVADISLYTGIAALAAATMILVIENRHPSSSSTGLGGPAIAVSF